jgi:mannose/cellobiose epimerase-like protein (N-acyl-D-glucosamine 2-epimerase family)/glycosyltransferase involved in cell wall biosynthesis
MADLNTLSQRKIAAEDTGMSDTTARAQALQSWLFECALPLWWDLGADRARGGFHEAIDLDGRPGMHPHRARTIARQAFSYCEAGRLGWDGPWREAAQHALDYFRKHFIRSDGTISSVVDLDGGCLDPGFYLYDQAFALLAYAAAHRAFGEAAGWDRAAVRLRTTLEQKYAHPIGGFIEDHRRQSANPHMHLLEAALAWSALDADPGWRQMADGLAAACLERMIDPTTGALREFFAADWTPAPGIAGRICEPGHHYEWAFLLDRWATLTRSSRPGAVSKLISFADAHGLDHVRGVAINAVLIDGTVHDPVARLWAQAEWIRAYLIDGRSDAQIAAAAEALGRFLATPNRGLWFDRLDANGNFVIEPARATSLYHIIGVVTELSARLNAIGDAKGGVPEGKREACNADSLRSRPERDALAQPVAHGTELKVARRGRRGERPAVIYLVTEDWYFVSHRLPMARAARAAGFEVHVATRIDRHGAAIEAEGFHLHPISWRRGSLDPRDMFRVLREVRRLYRELMPDLAHHVALPSAFVGSLAAVGLPIGCVNAMTGLGTLFISSDPKIRAARALLTPVLGRLLSRASSVVLVQNLDDRGVIESFGVDRGRIALIPGSGVDTDVMAPVPEPAGPIAIGFLGRLVEAKGIRTLVEAHTRLCARGREIRLVIAGTPDPANAGSIPAEEIEAWARRGNITYAGFVQDVAALWASVHIAVLPSHREGLPLSLLQAAACGRPLIATDVPGCREIARRDYNALLVPLGDVEALAQAIERLALDPELRRRFGAASRVLAEREFSSQRIGRDLIGLYRRVLER